MFIHRVLLCNKASLVDEVTLPQATITQPADQDMTVCLKKQSVRSLN